MRLPEPQRQKATELLALVGTLLKADIHGADPRTRFLLEQTARNYLPGTVQAYLELSVGARQQLAAQGQNPEALLSEQLQLMIDGVKQATRLDYVAADRLVNQGRFLRERFGLPGDRRP
ncbi:hypothetical protein [Deinococcus sp.]|uniref:hypothetical protein n=1 Tax=Deinococcus sp. TaxID=47478 RepID=UPI0025BC40BA|nr:hypothetical protein [Deinococcus sp.]